MKIQNNKTRIRTTIVTAIVMIVLLMSSPMTLLPLSSADSTVPTSNVPPGLSPTAAKNLQIASQKVSDQMKGHSGWIGIIKYNGDKMDILYVGDPAKSPYQKPGMHRATSGVHPLIAGTCPNSILQQQGEPTSFTDSGVSRTTAYHIQQKYNSIQSGSTSSDLLQTLNALNDNSHEWMQVSSFYDKASCTGTGAGWYYNLDTYDTTQIPPSENGNPQAVSFTGASNDVIYEDVYANSGTDYQLCVTDVSQSPSTGGCFTKTYSGDSYSNLNLGTTCSVQACDTGTMMEEISSSTTTTPWSWATWSQYTMKFQYTSNSNLITTCNGWVFDPAAGPNNPVSTTSSTSPTCYDSMKY
ncbi:MAG: hypothetical protein ACRDFB_02920 [Rhabdochlamydiaceae bacterium]